MTDEIHVTDIPINEVKAFLAEHAGTPGFIFYAQVVPPGYDAEADRLRALGRVQVFKRPRPVKVRDVDKSLHKLVRYK